jgi:hypothetical protein
VVHPDHVYIPLPSPDLRPAFLLPKLSDAADAADRPLPASVRYASSSNSTPPFTLTQKEIKNASIPSPTLLQKAVVTLSERGCLADAMHQSPMRWKGFLRIPRMEGGKEVETPTDRKKIMKAHDCSFVKAEITYVCSLFSLLGQC